MEEADGLRSKSYDRDPVMNEKLNLLPNDIPIATAQDNAESQFCNPTVTIYPKEQALLSSEIAARLQPHLPPFELSFWTDACVPGSKLQAQLKCAPNSARGLVGFCVVHRRWDVLIPRPGDPLWSSTWWLSGFIATNTFSVWQAEAKGVVQALKMAVHHCEQISGIIIHHKGTTLRKNRVSGPMPKLVNIFSDSTYVLRSLGGLSDPDKYPKDKWLNTTANYLFAILGKHGVEVNLQYVPAHAGDVWNCWAHEGARLSLNPRLHRPIAYRKQVHRVMLKARNEKGVTKNRLLTAANGGIFKKNNVTFKPESPETEGETDMLDGITKQ